MVPPQYRRFAPFLLIVLVLLVVFPLLRRSSSGPSNADRAQATKTVLRLIDRGELHYLTANQRYTSHLADLVPTNKQLAGALASGFAVQLDVSSDGRSYLAQVESTVLSLVRARTGDKVTADSCLIVKKSSGVDCTPLTA